MKNRIPTIVYIFLFAVILTFAYHRFICCKSITIPKYDHGQVQTVIFESKSDYQTHTINYSDSAEIIDSLCNLLAGDYHFIEHKSTMFMSSGGTEKLTLIGNDGKDLIETEIRSWKQDADTVCIQIVSNNRIYQSDSVYKTENIGKELDLFVR